MTPLGIEPVTFWLGAQCINELHHHVTPLTAWYVAETISYIKSCLAVACLVQTHVGPNTMHCTVQRNLLLDPEKLKIKGTELKLGQHSGSFLWPIQPTIQWVSG